MSSSQFRKLPSAELHSGFPPEKFDLAQYSAGKSIIDKLQKEGIDEIIVYCVNDGAVMSAWAKDLGVEHFAAGDKEGPITLVGDPDGTLTKKLDMEMTHPGPASVGIIGRCKRFALYAVDAEDDPAGDDDPSATLAPAVLSAIVSMKDEL
ncbi:hypothetical protein ACHAWF_005182 [Thalassiosira exigua]